ncbi:MAG: aminomethyltransferase beta-barrel domain-containing protein, partial [Terriglobia bacterium]
GRELTAESGEIVTTDGAVIGRHEGLHRYTVGQRRGLGFATGRPIYVVEIDRANNRLIVGDDGELFTSVCEVRDVNWISIARPDRPVEANVKVRHRHAAASALIEPLDATTARIRFREPQRAITPGQAAVFYSADTVLGGGWLR